MTNLLKNIEIDEAKFKKLLLAGELHEFEETFYAFVMKEIYDKCVKIMINSVAESKEFKAKMSNLASINRMGKLQKRSVNLQIRTGTYITVELQYARVAKNRKFKSLFRLSILGNHRPSKSKLL